MYVICRGLFCCVCIEDSSLEEGDASRAQELISCLQVLQVVAPAMHTSLHSQVFLICVSVVDSHLKHFKFLPRLSDFLVVLGGTTDYAPR